MLIEESGEQSAQQANESAIMSIGGQPVMQTALDVLSLLGSKPTVILRAKGSHIPNAVAVANIITEKMLCGNSKVQKITLDTDGAPGIGRMLSTIEIILHKD